MTIIDHPKALLPAGIAAQLSTFAHEAEKLGDLHPKQLEPPSGTQWFRKFNPKLVRGLGPFPPEVVRLEESLGWADGRTAWVGTLCAGGGWFVGFVEAAIAREFFTGDRV